MQRILIVKPCCLGDALMATPVLRALRSVFPDAALDVAVSPWAAPAFEGHPAVHRLIPYPMQPNLGQIARLARKLARERYDCALGLDRSAYVGALMWMSRIPLRAGLATGWRTFFYTHPVAPTPAQHETETYLAVSRTLGVPERGLAPEYVVAHDVREAMRARLAGFSRPLVVIHPGGAVNPGSRLLAKRWPPERFARLADALATEFGATVILTGATNDEDTVAAVCQAVRSPHVVRLDRLSWRELAALLALADLFVGNDTGAGHLAAAVGTPTVSIFGPTNPARYRPLGPRSLVCAPPASWQLPDQRDLRRPFSIPEEVDIRRVSVEEVLTACRRLLEYHEAQT
jgi:heptosyltransferase-2/heptosyltransferase-3